MTAIRTAALLLGGQVEIARLLAISPGAVSQLVSCLRATPPDRCPDIERATAGRVPCEELRPDVRWQRVPDPTWPHPDGRPCLDVARPLPTTTTPQETRNAA